ncbi:hypothetical protein D3C77_478250 [compost metagenome]
MDLRAAIRTFHFHMLDRPGRLFRRGCRVALLPPEGADADHDQQQYHHTATQHGLRQARGLLDPAQAVQIAGDGAGARHYVEVMHQLVLVQLQQLGIGPDIATRKGKARQLVEFTGLQIGQGIRAQVQLHGDIRFQPAAGFTRHTQGFTGMTCGGRFGFRIRRVHHCSVRYSRYSCEAGYKRLS